MTQTHFTGSNVDFFSTGNIRADYIINRLMGGQMLEYWQFMIHYETGTLVNSSVSANTYRFTYQNWNSLFVPEVFLNGGETPLHKDLYEVDYEHGRITMRFELQPNDNVQVTYNFSYFTADDLYSYILRALSTCNTAGVGVTNYTIDDAPINFDGVLADLAIAMCMERLIVDYDVWKGRLVFAISPSGLYEGSDNIISNLELIKRNCEERAYKSVENPTFKLGRHLAKPTSLYYRSIMYGNGMRTGLHGTSDYGKLRGIVINKGVFGGSLGI